MQNVFLHNKNNQFEIYFNSKSTFTDKQKTIDFINKIQTPTYLISYDDLTIKNSVNNNNVYFVELKKIMNYINGFNNLKNFEQIQLVNPNKKDIEIIKTYFELDEIQKNINVKKDIVDKYWKQKHNNGILNFSDSYITSEIFYQNNQSQNNNVIFNSKLISQSLNNKKLNEIKKQNSNIDLTKEKQPIKFEIYQDSKYSQEVSFLDGGVHSAIKNFSETNKNIYHIDANNLYPSIMIKYGLFPNNFNQEEFIRLWKSRMFKKEINIFLKEFLTHNEIDIKNIDINNVENQKTIMEFEQYLKSLNINFNDFRANSKLNYFDEYINSENNLDLMLYCFLTQNQNGIKNHPYYSSIILKLVQVLENSKKLDIEKKLLVNIYGNLNNQYCKFNTPNIQKQICYEGQNIILTFLDKILDNKKVKVVNINTDAIDFIYEGKQEELQKITEELFKQTGISFAIEKYDSLYQKDVNNLIKIENNKVDNKGFVDDFNKLKEIIENKKDNIYNFKNPIIDYYVSKSILENNDNYLKEINQIDNVKLFSQTITDNSLKIDGVKNNKDMFYISNTESENSLKETKVANKVIANKDNKDILKQSVKDNQVVISVSDYINVINNYFENEIDNINQYIEIENQNNNQIDLLKTYNHYNNVNFKNWKEVIVFLKQNKNQMINNLDVNLIDESILNLYKTIEFKNNNEYLIITNNKPTISLENNLLKQIKPVNEISKENNIDYHYYLTKIIDKKEKLGCKLTPNEKEILKQDKQTVNQKLYQNQNINIFDNVDKKIVAKELKTEGINNVDKVEPKIDLSNIDFDFDKVNLDSQNKKQETKTELKKQTKISDLFNI